MALRHPQGGSAHWWEGRAAALGASTHGWAPVDEALAGWQVLLAAIGSKGSAVTRLTCNRAGLGEKAVAVLKGSLAGWGGDGPQGPPCSHSALGAPRPSCVQALHRSDAGLSALDLGGNFITGSRGVGHDDWAAAGRGPSAGLGCASGLKFWHSPCRRYHRPR